MSTVSPSEASPAAAAAPAEQPAELPLVRPRFFYGWVILPIAMAGFIATSPGQTYGISVFNNSLRDALGLSSTQLAGAYMLGTLLASLPMGYVGALMDRHGLRRTMIGVLVLFSLACVGMAFVSNLATLFLGFLGLRMLGQGALTLLSSNALAFWFDRRLGTVEGIRNFGVAGAIAVVPSLNLWLIDVVGWRWAYVILGVAVAGSMLPLVVLFLRNRPEDIGQCKDGDPPGATHTTAAATTTTADGAACPVEEISFTLAQALRTRAFWIVGAAMALWSLSNTGVLFNIVPIVTGRGMSEGDASVLFVTFAISLAVTNLLGGYMADRMPLNLLLSASVLGMAVAMGLIRVLAEPSGLISAGIALGASQGLLVAVTAPMWPRYYGRAHIGKIRGLLATVLVASSSVGPMVMGLALDLTGSFDPVLTAFTVVPLALAALSLLATRPAQQIARQAAV